MIRFLLFFLLAILFQNSSFSTLLAQSTIPRSYIGETSSITRGVLNGNQIETNFRNHGEFARWSDIPFGTWPQENGGEHIAGIGLVTTALVYGERAKWPNIYGENKPDTTIAIVSINYRQAGLNQSPFTGNAWGWLPLPGFNNSLRTDPNTFGSAPTPALSNDPTSWPAFWPDKLGDDMDIGWQGKWNGAAGKNLVTGTQESYYVMDDFSNKKYQFEDLDNYTNVSSEIGIYYPNSEDSTMGGLGLQTEVRTFQWDTEEAEDILFINFRTTNLGDKSLDKVWSSLLIDLNLGVFEEDDFMEFFKKEAFLMAWDSDGKGLTYAQREEFDLGYVGFVLLNEVVL